MTAVRVIRYQDTASTNTIALQLGREGCAAGTVVTARQQSGGRGRRSRQFCSPPGGLYMSLVLRPRLAGSSLPLVTLAAGVAAAQSVEQVAGAAVPVELKWPNDLYMAGRKLGGILTEGGPYDHAAGRVPFIVVGLGLNVNTERKSFPTHLQESVTSLYDVLHRRFDLDWLLEVTVQRMTATVAGLEKDPEGVLRSWRCRDHLRGREVRWHDDQGSVIRGTAAGLLADGCYGIVSVDGRRHAVLAGDLVVLTTAT